MCTCASCEYTDGFSGWRKERDRQGGFIPDLEHGGFDRWPRGNPAGPRKSKADYAAHVAHLWEGVYRNVPFTPGQPQKFNIQGLVMPVTPAPKYVLDFISSGYAMRPDLWKRVDGRWEPVDTPTQQPKRVPRLIALARELRKAA
jgi:hypothetical protein